MRDKYFKVLKAQARRYGWRWLRRQGIHYLKILASVIRGRALTGPISATVMLTYRCNHRCTMCDFPSRVKPDLKEMNTAEVKALLVEIASLPTSGVSFYGGEPLLRKDVVELIYFARSIDLTTHLTTNGSLLSRELARELVQAGTNLISISLDGARKETHDRQRGTPGAYERALAAINNVLEARRTLSAETKLAVATTLTPDNITEIEKLMELVKDLGVDNYTVFETQCLETIPNRFDAEGRKKLLEANKKLLKFKEKYPSFIDNSIPYLEMVRKMLSGEPARLKCFAPYTDLFIDPYGAVFPCNHFLGMNRSMGKLESGRLTELWYSQQYQGRRDELASCSLCNYMCHRELSLVFNALWPFKKPKVILTSQIK